MFSIGESAAPLTPRDVFCANQRSRNTDRADEFNELMHVRNSVYPVNEGGPTAGRSNFARAAQGHTPFADWPTRFHNRLIERPNAWGVTVDCANERNQAQRATCVETAVQAWLDACWETDSSEGAEDSASAESRSAARTVSLTHNAEENTDEVRRNAEDGSRTRTNRRPAATRDVPRGWGAELSLDIDLARPIANAISTSDASETGVECHANSLRSPDLELSSEDYASCPTEVGGYFQLNLMAAYFFPTRNFGIRGGVGVALSPSSSQENVSGPDRHDANIWNFDLLLEAGFTVNRAAYDAFIYAGALIGVQTSTSDENLRFNGDTGPISSDDFRHFSLAIRVGADFYLRRGNSPWYAILGLALQIDVVSNADIQTQTEGVEYRIGTPLAGFLVLINLGVGRSL